jgi:hypothetical protein
VYRTWAGIEIIEEFDQDSARVSEGSGKNLKKRQDSADSASS